MGKRKVTTNGATRHDLKPATTLGKTDCGATGVERINEVWKYFFLFSPLRTSHATPEAKARDGGEDATR